MIDENDPYRWTSIDSDDREAEPFEHDYHTGRHASRGQIVLAKNQDAPLTAASGNCLLIVLYWKQTRIGMIIHLGRDEKLFDAPFIESAFNEYEELRESARIYYISTADLLRDCGQQVTDLEKLFNRLCKSPMQSNLLVQNLPEKWPGGDMFPMSVDIELYTAEGVLAVLDEYGEHQGIRLVE